MGLRQFYLDHAIIGKPQNCECNKECWQCYHQIPPWVAKLVLTLLLHKSCYTKPRKELFLVLWISRSPESKLIWRHWLQMQSSSRKFRAYVPYNFYYLNVNSFTLNRHCVHGGIVRKSAIHLGFKALSQNLQTK